MLIRSERGLTVLKSNQTNITEIRNKNSNIDYLKINCSIPLKYWLLQYLELKFIGDLC